jgi:hypothetical protein
MCQVKLLQVKLRNAAAFVVLCKRRQCAGHVLKSMPAAMTDIANPILNVIFARLTSFCLWQECDSNEQAF